MLHFAPGTDGAFGAPESARHVLAAPELVIDAR